MQTTVAPHSSTAINKRRGKTYNEILDRSMELFNDYGIESVSNYRVAESLGISPGNLTYHFKLKRNLLDALLNRLEKQFVGGIGTFPYVSDARSFVTAYAELFGITWNHRGIFNSAPYLIQSGLVTAARFRTLSERITNMMVKRTETLVAQGFMARIRSPYHVQVLIDCIWWQWLGWLRVNQLREPDEHISFEEIVKNAIDHCIFLVRPYMKRDYASKLYQALQDLDIAPPVARLQKAPAKARRSKMKV